MADLLRCAISNLLPTTDEKFDFFFLWVLAKDCISKVLFIIFEALAVSFDLQLFSPRSPSRPLLCATQQLWVDLSSDSRLSLLSLLRSKQWLGLPLPMGSLSVLVRSGKALTVFSLLLLFLLEGSRLTVWARLLLISSPLISSLTCSNLLMRCLRSRHFLVRDINFINVYCYIPTFIPGDNHTLRASLCRLSIIFHQHYMATSFDWVKLNQQADYKFFACVVADKLRNSNFKPVWRETFLKTLLEEIKPVCTFRTYERIEKLLNEVANQKHLEEKEEEERLKKLSNKKIDTKVSLKVQRHVRKHNIHDEDESLSDDDDGEM